MITDIMKHLISAKLSVSSRGNVGLNGVSCPPHLVGTCRGRQRLKAHEGKDRKTKKGCWGVDLVHGRASGPTSQPSV